MKIQVLTEEWTLKHVLEILGFFEINIINKIQISADKYANLKDELRNLPKSVKSNSRQLLSARLYPLLL